MALLLHFAHGTAPLDASFVLGTQFEAELCFFPGHSVRAVLKSRGSKIEPIEQMTGSESLTMLCDAYSTMLATQPWLGAVALPVKSLVPTRAEKVWQFSDTYGGALPMAASDDIGWTAMAVSGGDPIDVVVEFDGRSLRPLSLVAQREFICVSRNASAGRG